MRVIITGGTGLIGRALVDDLSREDHEIIVLSRSPERYAGTMPAGVELVAWDARSAEGWGALADGADAIVNLAAASLADGRWTDERKRRILESRTQGAAAVLDAVERAETKPRVVIQSSAVGYYGPTGDREVTEHDGPGDDFAARVCGAWEEAAAPIADAGSRLAIIRTGVVLDADEGALPRMVQPYRMFVGGPVGSGRQYLSWIHLADVVAGIRFLIERQDASGPFNLCSPQPERNADFGRAIGAVLDRPSLVPAPSFALKALFGEMSSVVLEGQRALPARLQEMGFAFRFPEAEAALRDVLG